MHCPTQHQRQSTGTKHSARPARGWRACLRSTARARRNGEMRTVDAATKRLCLPPARLRSTRMLQDAATSSASASCTAGSCTSGPGRPWGSRPTVVLHQSRLHAVLLSFPSVHRASRDSLLEESQPRTKIKVKLWVQPPRETRGPKNSAPASHPPSPASVLRGLRDITMSAGKVDVFTGLRRNGTLFERTSWLQINTSTRSSASARQLGDVSAG